jgi:hypothetical protein
VKDRGDLAEWERYAVREYGGRLPRTRREARARLEEFDALSRDEQIRAFKEAEVDAYMILKRPPTRPSVRRWKV